MAEAVKFPLMLVFVADKFNAVGAATGVVQAGNAGVVVFAVSGEVIK